MKTIKIIVTVFSLSVMYQFAAAQCPSNKVWTCRIDSCYNQECRCLFPSQVASWTAIVPSCHYNYNYHCHHCSFRSEQNESGIEIETSLQVYPNPASSSTSIFFSLSQAQKVSFKLIDMTGRLVKTVAEEIFEEGDNEFIWNASDTPAGIYFLKMETESSSEIKKISVIK